ncbi:hypothetical protein H6503_00530 [Candidatus Woesearchaeota archaeon]|nr:hypothetical protein [Candidatus Woesearchaeota archaeon]
MQHAVNRHGMRMEKYIELREKALSNLKQANHGISFTYPLIKENKVLLNIVNHLFLACTNNMASILAYEMTYKRIDPFEDNFESKLRIFKNSILERYNLDQIYVKLMRDFKEIIIAHNESPIEFSRGNKFIICNDNYELKEITIDSLKKAADKTKVFIDEGISITSRGI